MTPTAAVTTILLLYLLALFLTVATLWLFSRAAKTVSQIETGLPYFVVLIIVVLPFVMLIFFGLAFLISDTISVRTGWLAAPEDEPSFAESLVLAISYVGLSGWLWLRWRNPSALSTNILGPAIIATVTILIIVGVSWAAHHDYYF